METKELWMDEEFCKKVDAASDTEEIIRLFAEKGVTVTAEQIASVKALRTASWTKRHSTVWQAAASSAASADGSFILWFAAAAVTVRPRERKCRASETRSATK